jgi:transposase
MKEPKFVDGLKFEGMPKFEGLDLAKRTMEVYVLRGGQKPQRFSGIGTGEAGREKLAGMPGSGDTVGMEAGAYAFVLARYLKRQTGCTVYVLNPGKRAMIGKPTRQTDKEDARKIAQFIQRYPKEELPLAAVPSENDEELRSLVPMKGFLTRERTKAVNRLSAVYVQAG